MDMASAHSSFLSLLLHVVGMEIPWCFSQVKGTIEDEVAEGNNVETTTARPCIIVIVLMPMHGARA